MSNQDQVPAVPATRISQKRKTMIVVGFALLTLAGVGAAVAMKAQGSSGTESTLQNLSSALNSPLQSSPSDEGKGQKSNEPPEGKKPPPSITGVIVATVNGEPIYESEILAEMQSGAPGSRNDVLQGYINSVLIAQGMNGTQESKETALYSQRKALSGMAGQQFFSKNLETVSKNDVISWHERHLSDGQFDRYQFSYYLTQSESDAEEQLQKFKSGKDLDRLTVFGEKGKPRWASGQEVPYGVGRILQKMAKGEMLHKPLIVSNGYLILKLIDVEKGKRPELAEVEGQVRAAIVQQRFAENIEAKRKSADIRIK